MLITGLLAGVETGLNRILRLDGTALPRLHALAGKVIAVHCQSPALELFILPSGDGLQLASQWHAPADCTLTAPAASLARLALSREKTAVLHRPEVSLDGDSAALMQ
ncbi:MAG: SCP2 sterol-binding domain-containing protein, partial [Pseudomonas sp.]|nr:SCP2 sterol-binding domain-containing protein [Pseudomonas sp.]